MWGTENFKLGYCIFGIVRVHTNHFTLLVNISLYYVGMLTQVGDLIINKKGTGLQASGNVCSLD